MTNGHILYALVFDLEVSLFARVKLIVQNLGDVLCRIWEMSWKLSISAGIVPCRDRSVLSSQSKSFRIGLFTCLIIDLTHHLSQ